MPAQHRQCRETTSHSLRHLRNQFICQLSLFFQLHILHFQQILNGSLSHFAGGIPSCCLNTRTNISAHILLKVHRVDVQQSSGACDIPALV